ncbi:MAG: hypothetical protein KDD94_06710 [Calditrichaeota bacterium]|nr:hypothetical protein [Calditrichota bacterium]
MNYQIEWLGNIVHVKYSGNLTDDLIYLSNKEIYESEQFPMMRGQLIDMLEIKRDLTTKQGMLAIAAKDLEAARKNPWVKVALLINKGLIIGSRMYELAMRGSSWRTEMFYDLDTAITWLQTKQPNYSPVETEH